jgi:hypothetical protein
VHRIILKMFVYIALFRSVSHIKTFTVTRFIFLKTISRNQLLFHQGLEECECIVKDVVREEISKGRRHNSLD